MRVRIEISDDVPEDEIIIKCRSYGEELKQLQSALVGAGEPGDLVFYKGSEEFYFPVSNVLFFETENDAVHAHTVNDVYRIKLRLFELEAQLPPQFLRVSKSSILNMQHILSIDRNVSGASRIGFTGSHKQVYASRLYYKNLKLRMNEKRMGRNHG